MANVENVIKELMKTPRNDYIFMRRRVDKGNGKKTLGWMLKLGDQIIEDIDFTNLKNYTSQLENNLTFKK